MARRGLDRESGPGNVDVLSGWFLLILVPLTEALLLHRWSPGYFRTGLVVASYTVPASRAPLPSGIEADLELHFDEGSSDLSSGWHRYSLVFHRFSSQGLAFRGNFGTCLDPRCALFHFLWPVLLHGELRAEGTSPCVTVRGQCSWSLLVCLLVSAWELLDTGFAPSVLLLPVILGGCLFWVRTRVRAIALAVTGLLALQDR
jgi:hypothetical protein